MSLTLIILKISLRQPTKGSEREWREALEIFLREIFITRMGLSKGYKIIVLDSLLYPFHFRTSLLYVLLTRFRFSSVKFLVSESASLFAIPPKTSSNPLFQTGLIVDIGYKDTRVLPVYDGIALVGKLKQGGASSYDVLQRLKALLLEFGKCSDINGNFTNINFDQLNVRTLENLLSQICFTCELSHAFGSPPALKYPPEVLSCFHENVDEAQELSKSDDSLSKIYESESKRIPKVNFSLDRGFNIEIDGFIRSQSTEVLFENTEDYPSVAALILDSLLSVRRIFLFFYYHL